MSFSARSQSLAWSPVSLILPPSGGSVSSRVCAKYFLASRSEDSVYLRNSPAFSGSSL